MNILTRLRILGLNLRYFVTVCSALACETPIFALLWANNILKQRRGLLAQGTTPPARQHQHRLPRQAGFFLLSIPTGDFSRWGWSPLLLETTMNNVLETLTIDGYTVEICHDHDVEHPRAWCSSTLCSAHRRYDFGGNIYPAIPPLLTRIFPGIWPTRG